MHNPRNTSPFVVSQSPNRGKRRRRPNPVTMMSPVTMTQMDFVEERMLAQQAREAAKNLERKREEIRRALECGAQIEPGLRTARLRTSKAMLIR